MKYCSSCSKHKALEQFYKDRTRRDGHAYICKQCKNVLVVAVYGDRAEEQHRYRISKRGAYLLQRAQAIRRGITWEFTFDSWVKWWGSDWDSRGGRPSDLCMARYNDEGPYHPSNVTKATMADNLQCLI